MIKSLHRPGIEPGPPAWQASILPLNHRCRPDEGLQKDLPDRCWNWAPIFFHPGEFEPLVTRGVWAFSTVWTSLQTRGMDTSTASQHIHFLVWVNFPPRGTCLFFYLNGYRKKPATFAQDEVAEWLRRWTANPLGSARVGSNPILVDAFNGKHLGGVLNRYQYSTDR